MPRSPSLPRADGWTVRVVLQTYEPEAHAYREAGMSVAGFAARTDEELARLWIMLQEVIEDRRWTDRFQASQKPVASEPSQV